MQYVWHRDHLAATLTVGDVPLVIKCDACPPGTEARICTLNTNDREAHAEDCGCPNAGRRVVRQQLLCNEQHAWLTIPYHHSGKRLIP